MKEGEAIKKIATDIDMCKAIGDKMDAINNTIKRYNTDPVVKWAYDKVKINKVSSLSVLYNLYSVENENILEKDDADVKNTIQEASLLMLDNLHESLSCSSRTAAAFPSAKKVFKEKSKVIYATMLDNEMISDSEHNTLVKNIHSPSGDLRLLDLLFDEDAVQEFGKLSLLPRRDEAFIHRW